MIATERRAGTVKDLRGYGPPVVERLKDALEKNAAMWPDARHPRLFFLLTLREGFYIFPLPSGKILLLARWPN